LEIEIEQRMNYPAVIWGYQQPATLAEFEQQAGGI
jgi:hypothetical protein